MRKSIIVWAVSVAAAAAVSAGVTAQVVQSGRVGQPRIVSGSDIGFRVEGQRREPRTDSVSGRTAPIDILTGHLVVKVNGEWIEAEVSGRGIRPATN